MNLNMSSKEAVSLLDLNMEKDLYKKKKKKKKKRKNTLKLNSTICFKKLPWVNTHMLVSVTHHFFDLQLLND